MNLALHDVEVDVTQHGYTAERLSHFPDLDPVLHRLTSSSVRSQAGTGAVMIGGWPRSRRPPLNKNGALHAPELLELSLVVRVWRRGIVRRVVGGTVGRID